MTENIRVWGGRVRIYTETHAECRRCGEVKPHNEFYKDKSKSQGIGSRCKACDLKKNKQRRTDPEKRWWDAMSSRARKYGIDAAQIMGMWYANDGRCPICQRSMIWNRWECDNEGLVAVIDHNHETGRVRGLICGSCNHALGMFRDNPDIAESAARYIEDFQHANR